MPPFVLNRSFQGRAQASLRDFVAENMGMEVLAHRRDDVDLNITVLSLGDVYLSRIDNRTGPIAAEATARVIATDHRPQGWIINFGIAGGACVTLGGRSSLFPDVRLQAVRTSEPRTAALARGTSVGLLFLPDTKLKSTLGRVPHAEPFMEISRSSRTRPAENAFAFAFNELVRATPRQWDELVDALVRLFGAALERSADASEQAAPSAQLFQRKRVLRFIEEHLDEPRLNPEFIASRLGYSKRHLYRLFETSDVSLEARIVARRLERSLESLADPRHAHETITQIALSWGFADVSHFSRSFRARFGMTAREARANALDTTTPRPLDRNTDHERSV